MVKAFFQTVEGSSQALEDLLLLCCRSEYSLLFATELLRKVVAVLEIAPVERIDDEEGASKRRRLGGAAAADLARRMLLELELAAVWGRLAPAPAPAPFASWPLRRLDDKQLLAVQIFDLPYSSAPADAVSEVISGEIKEIIRSGATTSFGATRLFSRLFR